MLSQWDCLLKNLGEWQGSFTRLSATGEVLEDIPSVVSLDGINNNKTVHQVVRRSPPGQTPNELILEYSSLGRSILFHETGAFSQGSIQWSPYATFGAELGLIEGDRRLRLVQLYNQNSQLDQLTLIREKLAGSDTPERPVLSVEQLLGEWQGEAVSVYPDLRPPQRYPTRLQIQSQDSNHLIQHLTFGTGVSGQTITSTARIEGNCLYFEEGKLPVQVLLLPDGASSNCPLVIKARCGFVLEVGWLLQPNHRQRLLRSYNSQGEWVNLTLVTEQKIATTI